jgi:ariadne-1
VFCFACYVTSHSPVPCEWAKSWLEKCTKESANANYIVANCKPCPRCKKQIQKGDGCNHLTCICGQSMCWLCGEATGRVHDAYSIQDHTCNKFRLGQGTAAGAKEQLDTFIHYFDRYQVHIQSLKKAKEVEAMVNQKVETLSLKGDCSRHESELADWLWIGLKQLFRMRRFIAWTYVFAFYAFYEENGKRIKSSEAKIAEAGAFFFQTIFEDLQSKLQSAIEELSRLVEMKAENMDFNTKAGVLKYSNTTHQLAMNLWKYVAEEILTKGIDFHNIPNVYFPIRRMVSGLGAKEIEESDGMLVQKMPVVALGKIASDSKNKKLKRAF